MRIRLRLSAIRPSNGIRSLKTLSRVDHDRQELVAELRRHILELGAGAPKLVRDRVGGSSEVSLLFQCLREDDVVAGLDLLRVRQFFAGFGETRLVCLLRHGGFGQEHAELTQRFGFTG